MVIVGNVPTPSAPGPTGNIRRINFRDVILRNNSSYLLRITGGLNPTPLSILCSYERCVLAGNLADALLRIETRNTTQAFRQVHFTSFRGKAIELDSCEGVSFNECTADTGLDNDAAVPYLSATEAGNCQVMNCTFAEGNDPPPTATRWFIDLGRNCNGWTIFGTRFVRKAMGDNTAKAIRLGEVITPPDPPLPPAGACYAVAIIDPTITVPSGTPLVGSPIEIRNPGSECLIAGGFTEIGTAKVALEVLDPTKKSVWIGHRRWRPPTLKTSEVAEVLTNRHLGDILVREGIGVQAYSARARVPSSDNAWLPLSVNRVSNEAALGALALSSKESGTIVWVDAPDPGKSPLQVWNGLADPPAWMQLVI